MSAASHIVGARIRQPVKGARRYVKISEAAQYLGVHEATIRAMMTDGRLRRYSGLGDRLLRVDLNEIDAAMEPGGDPNEIDA